MNTFAEYQTKAVAFLSPENIFGQRQETNTTSAGDLLQAVLGVQTEANELADALTSLPFHAEIGAVFDCEMAWESKDPEEAKRLVWMTCDAVGVTRKDPTYGKFLINAAEELGDMLWFCAIGLNALKYWSGVAGFKRLVVLNPSLSTIMTDGELKEVGQEPGWLDAVEPWRYSFSPEPLEAIWTERGSFEVSSAVEHYHGRRSMDLMHQESQHGRFNIGSDLIVNFNRLQDMAKSFCYYRRWVSHKFKAIDGTRQRSRTPVTEVIRMSQDFFECMMLIRHLATYVLCMYQPEKLDQFCNPATALRKIAEMNILKLESRYKNGYSDFAATVRDVVAEYSQMEDGNTTAKAA